MKIRKILVPTDFSPNSYLAAEAANELACRYKADVTLFYVESTHEYLVLDLGTPAASEEREFEMRHFDEAKALMDSSIDVSIAIDRGPAHESIVEYARNHSFDLIVIATHGRSGIQRFLLGSTTEKVVRSAECAVLLIHPDDDTNAAQALANLECVVMPTDLSDVSNQALDTAVALAERYGAKLVLTHVVEPLAHIGFGTPTDQVYALQRGLQQATENGLEKLRGLVPANVEVECVALEGLAHTEICQLAARSPNSLVVMATHGHSGVKRWLLGSVTDRVARVAERPVWIVK